MDIFLLLLGFFFIFLGIIGSFLPVLPGPITGWIGLLLLHLTKIIPLDWTFLGITLGISVLIWGLDYIIPAWGTKKFGGSKYGIWGTMLGLIVGLIFMGPLGIIIGPFIGAFIGEMIHDSTDGKRATKAAFGSFVGFMLSTGLKFLVSIIFAGLYIAKFWDYKDVFFTFNQ
ncbi:DUF456 domain-containing protein [Urechidicola croceus]|uniref:DUF456 domain-containing protein n=1 Tax=Urechidicola croceus TaxID=1850246 RepID=A0A1D8PAV7_9FLAO|nr:DUF456 domain-containing protein [Urechidicola croceus]AOW21692.1 hypothetical protein LPB138_13820 [Urechidicola croceus]